MSVRLDTNQPSTAIVVYTPPKVHSQRSQEDIFRSFLAKRADDVYLKCLKIAEYENTHLKRFGKRHQIFTQAELKILSTPLQHEINDRLRLRRVRMQAVKDIAEGKPSSVISSNLCNGLKDFIAMIYQDGVAHLSQKLKIEPPCKYCIVGMGSLARNEAGLYPDFDNFIVVEKITPEMLRYLSLLTQYVADRVKRLGESEKNAPGFRLCFGDTNPPYLSYEERYSRTDSMIIQDMEMLKEQIPYLDPKRAKIQQNELDRLEKEIERIKIKSRYYWISEQIEILSHQPSTEENKKQIQGWEKEKVALKETYMQQKNKIQQEINRLHEKTSLTENDQKQLNELERDLSHWNASKGEEELIIESNLEKLPQKIGTLINGVTIAGSDMTLYDTFRQIVFRKVAKQEALKSIQKQIEGVTKRHLMDPSPIIAATLPLFFDIKKDLCRLLQGTIEALALFHGIEKISTIERIKDLKEKGFLQPQLADDLILTMEILIKWRIQIQSAYGMDVELVGTSPEAITTLQTEILQRLKELEKQIKEFNKNKELHPEDKENLQKLQITEELRKFYMNYSNSILQKIEKKQPQDLFGTDLSEQVIPTLRKLYRLVQMSVDETGTFNPKVFQ